MPNSPVRDSLRAIFGDVAPKLAQLTESVVFGDLWERKGLSKRDRSVVTLTALIALNQLEFLPAYLSRALDNGVTRDELDEIVTHLSVYVGFPGAIDAARVVNQVLQARGAS